MSNKCTRFCLGLFGTLNFWIQSQNFMNAGIRNLGMCTIDVSKNMVDGSDF